MQVTTFSDPMLTQPDPVLEAAARERKRQREAEQAERRAKTGDMVKTGTTILGTIIGAIAGNPVAGATAGASGGEVISGVINKDPVQAIKGVTDMANQAMAPTAALPGQGQHVTQGADLSGLSMNDLMAKKKRLDDLWAAAQGAASGM